MNHVELGQQGERLAAEHLREKGYRILEQNYRKGRGELDIICLDEEMLVAVEVKTRVSDVLGKPYQAVTRSKQRQLIQLMNKYIDEKKINYEVRFDVISIVLNNKEQRLEHIIDAFYPLV